MNPLLLMLALGCSPEPPAAVPEADLSARVSTTPAAPVTRVPIVTLPAEVLPASGDEMHVGPGVAGRIVGWRVALGARVAAGEPVAELASPAFQKALARVAALRVEVESRQAVAEDRARAVDAGVASAADLTEARAAQAASEAALRAAESTLSGWGGALSGQGASVLWRAPAAGQVVSLDCPVGSVTAEDRCLSLALDGDVALRVRVPERVLGRLVGASTARFTGADGRTSTFQEVQRAPALSARTRTLEVRLAPTAPDAPMPGSSGRATISVAAPADAQAVPARALTELGGQPVVFTGAASEWRPVSVEVLGRSGDRAIVSGLAPGADVATRGVFLLKSLHVAGEES